ncbi:MULTISPECIES: hypothetical protein [Lysobacter]|uniref:hypothetical protein n=1 Tax=Lysobacter TaxID=68 RepID=UPI001F45C837|nr:MULTISPECIES: hypothetical protein [Lysobacter]UJB19584.1 hypothetical protein L1A79_00340 [Lysobacter capsici]UJQ26690.1 hypothetical protein L2D09_14520 [Lysobacter gummosus]
MFTERSANQNIFYVGSQQLPKREIAPGDSVTLKAGGTLVQIRNVRLLQPYGFSGEIYGFEPALPESPAGLTIGQRVEFSERQVYSCGRPA